LSGGGKLSGKGGRLSGNSGVLSKSTNDRARRIGKLS
jgi:hypothetical protein